MKGIVQGSTVTGVGTAVAADLLGGKTAKSDIGSITGSMVDRGTVSTDITTKAQVVTIAAGKHSGTGTVQIAAAEQAKVTAANIKSGITILGQAGTYNSLILVAGSTYTVHFSNDNILGNDNGTWSTQSGTYTSMYYHTFRMGYPGTIRVTFTLTASDAGNRAYGRIYIGETAVGTERSTVSTAGETFTEDITVAVGDYVSICAKVTTANNGSTASVNNVYAKTEQNLICDPALNTD